MLEELGKGFTPAFAINGGDVVDYGWKGEYDSYDKVLEGLPWRTYHIPGNHDVRWSPLGLKIFEKRVGKPFRSFDALGCRFVVLDSTIPLSHYGHYESEQLRWLEADLKNVGRDQPVIVATHHWVGRDSVMIDNETALMRVLEPYNVKLILTGHGHNDLLWKWDGALCTMNKGLYQGSYQRVDVDWEKGVLRLSRRSAERPAMTLLDEVQLKQDRGKVPAVQVVDLPGRGVNWALSTDEFREVRHNGGKWVPYAEGRTAAAALMPGRHEAVVRGGEASRMRGLSFDKPDSNGKVRLAWQADLPGGVMSHLLLAEDRLFVSCMDGSVLAFDPDTGKEFWRKKTGGFCHSTPVVKDGLLVVGSADGKVHAFDVNTGGPKWTRETGGPVYASAAFGGGLAIIGSGDGKIYGLRVENGEVAWTYALPLSDTAFTQSVPQCDGERFYFGGWDKYTYALDVKTGHLVWRKICTASTFAFSPAIGGPAMDDRAIYIPANGNELYAFRKTDGELLWKATSLGDKFGYSAPCLANGRIYIGCLGDKAEARCVNATDGKEVWCAKVAGVIYDSSPAYSEGIVAVGSVNGVLNVIDAKSGSIHAQYRVGTGHFLSSPAMRGNRVFAATFADRIVALDIGT